MAVMDEFKKEREELKNAPLGKKIQWFFNYYTIHVVGVLVVLAIVISLIYTYATKKDTALHGLFINGYTDTSEENAFNQLYIEQEEINLNDESVIFETSLIMDASSPSDSMTAQQKLVTLIAAAELDVVVTDFTTYNDIVYDNSYMDLREILSSEQLTAWEPYLYYVDNATMKAVDEAMDGVEIDEERLAQLMEPVPYEEMEEPIPVGLYVPEESALLESYEFREDEILMGVLVNTQRIENVVGFIEVVMEQVK